MAQTHFKNLDREGSALHDSWDHIARIFLIVSVLSVLVWGACTLLREAVHVASHWVIGSAEHGAWPMNAIVLIGVLVSAGLVRGESSDQPLVAS